MKTFLRATSLLVVAGCCISLVLSISACSSTGTSSLKEGTANMDSFTTRWTQSSPMVIQSMLLLRKTAI